MLDTAVKKWVSRLLIFTFACLCLGPVELPAKKGYKGAWVVIEKLDGQKLYGELLKVEDDHLLLDLPPEIGNKIPIREIDKVKVKRKSNFLIGASIALGMAALIGGMAQSREMGGFLGGVGTGVVLFGGPAALAGGGLGTLMFRGYKTYHLVGADPATISEVLSILNKRARF